ncbi:uncharacterized mitochondrial protein AtMg00710-like [Miscanthus floridulus]|uniref:uncharacterized mitochondrial protein AtMg00710-like n=1 Tax=Miscanthus floridulus TaxID=154761 RepID=UPI0034574BC1
MPARLWGEALTTAVFILNRAPTKALKGKMPFKAWHGRKPSVSFLQTFGCIGHIRKTKPILTKLEDRSTPCLGSSKGRRVHHLDVKSTFLNDELAETVFVRQPLGFAVKGAEHRVLCLLKARLYGLW